MQNLDRDCILTEHNQKSEIFYRLSNNEKLLLVFWPGTMTSCLANFYEIPVNKLTDHGISIALYNPRGHGNSEGIYSLDPSVRDLLPWLEKRITSPIIGVGHSGGATGLTMLTKYLNLYRLFLVSPILDPRECLFFMYEHNFISSFIKLFNSDSKHYPLLKNVLSTPDWLNRKYWIDNNLGETLQFPLKTNTGMCFDSISSFLENIFLSQCSVKPLLQNLGQKCEIFLAESDEWYPKDVIITEANKSNNLISTPIQGSEHFFREYWKMIWDIIITRLFAETSPSRLQA